MKIWDKKSHLPNNLRCSANFFFDVHERENGRGEDGFSPTTSGNGAEG